MMKNFDGCKLDSFEEQAMWKMFWGIKKIMKIGDVQSIDVDEVKKRLILERWRHLTYHFTVEDLP